MQAVRVFAENSATSVILRVTVTVPTGVCPVSVPLEYKHVLYVKFYTLKKSLSTHVAQIMFLIRAVIMYYLENC